MSGAPANTRVLLLVEDNPGDADLFREFLSQAGRESYQIIHVPLLAEAVATLRTQDIDVVVLDLGLPDCAGLDGVKRVREVAAQIPIVVLTGADDEDLARACIDAGAQDYLAKGEARVHSFNRAIGYALSRVREAQLREVHQALEGYRALSSATQTTSVTAAIAGSGAVSLREPDDFEAMVRAYSALLQPYLSRLADRVEAPREAMDSIVTMLGQRGGGPRDLLDMHVTALDRVMAQQSDPGSRPVVFEARLLALQMMGLLVDFYRVGQRRRFNEGANP